jgi:AraC-like DNA-binding protein
MTERLFLRLSDDPPCAPETTVPAHTLAGFAVPVALQRLVAHVTAYEERFEDGIEVTERVLPDGALRLLVELRSGAADVRVAGASTKPVSLTMRGQMHGLSVTLNAGASLALFGIPAAELTERVVRWSDLVAGAHRDLPERLAAAPGDAARVRLVAQSLAHMQRAPDRAGLRLLDYALLRLRNDAGAGSVRDLAAGLQISERRLQQLFATHLGLPPRAWRRLQRLHGTMRLLRRSQPPAWAELAAGAGFYDQSHLINEFRALCGLTPEQFLCRVVSGSSNTGQSSHR